MEEDLRALKDNGWTPVSVSAVLRYVLEGDPLPDRPVLLVFDDGYRSFLTRALPLLRAHDAPPAVTVMGRQAQRAGAEPGGAFEPVFAYPYGSLEPLAEPLLQAHGFLATLTSEEHVNVLTRSADCLYLLGRLNRSAFLQTQDVLDWMESGR